MFDLVRVLVLLNVGYSGLAVSWLRWPGAVASLHCPWLCSACLGVCWSLSQLGDIRAGRIVSTIVTFATLVLVCALLFESSSDYISLPSPRAFYTPSRYSRSIYALDPLTHYRKQSLSHQRSTHHQLHQCLLASPVSPSPSNSPTSPAVHQHGNQHRLWGHRAARPPYGLTTVLQII